MKQREPFSLYSRKAKDDRIYWYYRAYDELGRRTSGRSTGIFYSHPRDREKSRREAARQCIALIGSGTLIPSKDQTLAQYADGWWIWDKCPYVRGRLARSHPERPAISRRYVELCRNQLRHHILPHLGHLRLSEITPSHIERWMLSLRDTKNLAPKTVNHCLGTLRVMYNEAARNRLVLYNPLQFVQPLAAYSKERGILTVEEVKKLFDEDKIEKYWNGNVRHFTINLLAASTGMRSGEIRALRDSDYFGDYVRVSHSYGKFGLGPTKTRRERIVPIPKKTAEYMDRFTGTGGYLFSATNGAAPIHNNRITEFFHETLARAGISEDKQKSRNLTFHGWRHFFNSVCRARNVPDSKLQRVTGHSTMESTERYTTYSLEDFRDVAEVQSSIFGTVQ